jgi:carbonic anhydrase
MPIKIGDEVQINVNLLLQSGANQNLNGLTIYGSLLQSCTIDKKTCDVNPIMCAQCQLKRFNGRLTTRVTLDIIDWNTCSHITQVHKKQLQPPK